MNKEQAIKILEEALNQATKKGSFNLVEVSQVLQALESLKQEVSSDKK
jgi:hypothetical protein